MRDLFVVLLIVGLAGLICLVGYNQQSLIDDLSATQDYATHVAGVVENSGVDRSVSERVIQLPEDGSLYYTTVLVHEDWQKRASERELVAWFSTQSELSSLKAQTEFQVAVPSQQEYKWHFKVVGDDLPAVMVQTDQGRVVYKMSGKNMPAGPEVMASDLVTLFEKRPWLRLRPWLRPRPCPCPKPGPTPEPEPKPGPNINVDVKIPDIAPPPEKRAVDTGADFWVILGVALAISAGLAVLWQWRKRVGF